MKSVTITLAICFLIAAGCSGAFQMNSVTKLSQLREGMQPDEVSQALGMKPKTTQVDGELYVEKYTLHENWKGFVPYFFVYDKDTKKLIAWVEDEEGYKKSQEQWTKIATEAGLIGSTTGAGGPPPGPNDPDLQRWITGNYYSYTGSTERKLALCASGKFWTNSESSYSASPNSDGTTDWGAVSQSGSSGTWSISGNRESGIISVRYTNGKTTSIKYQVGSGDGVMFFGGIKFAYAGVANCD